MTWTYVVAGVVGGAALTYGGVATYIRATTETAPYEVLASIGDFEIRDYPALTLVKSSCSKADSDNFSRLFNYI